MEHVLCDDCSQCITHNKCKCHELEFPTQTQEAPRPPHRTKNF